LKRKIEKPSIHIIVREIQRRLMHTIYQASPLMINWKVVKLSTGRYEVVFTEDGSDYSHVGEYSNTSDANIAARRHAKQQIHNKNVSRLRNDKSQLKVA